MISVKWELFSEASGSRIVGDQTTILPPWAEVSANAGHAAAKIVEEYFSSDPEVWLEWFGDEESAPMMLLITQPVSIAGRYHIEAEKVVKARAELVSEAI